MIAQGLFGMFGTLFTIAFNKINIKWSMTAANADSILTHSCDSRGPLQCCSGSFGWQHPQGPWRTRDDVFLHSAAGDHLGAGTLADTVVCRPASPSTRTAKQQAGSVPPVCDTVNALFARLQTSSVLQLVGDRFGTSHTTASTSGRPTSQNKSISSYGR